MFDFIKKSLMYEYLPEEIVERITKELSEVLDKTTKKSFKEFKLQLTLLSKRIDIIEFDLKTKHSVDYLEKVIVNPLKKLPSKNKMKPNKHVGKKDK